MGVRSKLRWLFERHPQATLCQEVLSSRRSEKLGSFHVETLREIVLGGGTGGHKHARSALR